METDRKHIIEKTWVNVCRFLLGVTFIFSGFVKAVDPLGSFYKIQDYLEAFGLLSWVPPFMPLLFGIGLAAIEFCIGVFLFLGIRRSMASWVALLLMCFMTPLTLYLAIADPVSDCGCFGDAVVLTNWQTFGKNVVLLVAAVFAFKGRKLIIRFISHKSAWMVSMYTLLFIFALSFYCLSHLPIFDFRPYKIGTDIKAGMEIPEGAKGDVFETTYIMEKDGKRQEFALDNYPDQVLADSSYTFLMVAHRIEEADDSNIDLINEIYDYSVEHGYHFYALTSSSQESIEEWCDRTGAEYPFCQMDDITLKTIIRSNPGLLLIKGGIILNKWSDNQLPDEYVLTDALDKLPLGRQKQVSDARTLAYVMLWFVIPLLLVLSLDLLVVRPRMKKHVEKQWAALQETTDNKP